MGVDGSEPAQRAAQRAFDLGKRLGESVTLAHVLPPPPVFSEPAVVLDIKRATPANLYETALLLSRPDQHVAWRGDRLPPDSLALVDRVRGATA